METANSKKQEVERAKGSYTLVPGREKLETVETKQNGVSYHRRSERLIKH